MELRQGRIFSRTSTRQGIPPLHGLRVIWASLCSNRPIRTLEKCCGKPMAPHASTGTELYKLTHSAPAVVDDSASSSNDAAIVIDVLANDSSQDAAIDASSIQVTTNPAHGSAVVQGGKIQYTPTSGFAGTDTFQYTVKDTQGVESTAATVTITVTAAVPPPTSSHGGGGSMTISSLLALLSLLLVLHVASSRLRVRR
jgi:hypothetical protein